MRVSDAGGSNPLCETKNQALSLADGAFFVYGGDMATYEYNEEDLPEVTADAPRTLNSGESYTIVHSGNWSMEFIDPPSKEDGDSTLEDVDANILAWLAYRAWLEKNPAKRIREELQDE